MNNNIDIKRLEILGLKPISVLSENLNLQYMLFSKCGVHGRSELSEILEKKLEDINNIGYCLWSHYGSSQNFTLEFLAKKKAKTEVDNVFLIMPYTKSQAVATNVLGKEDVCYTRFQVADETPQLLPIGMNDVTVVENGANTPSAYVIQELYYIVEDIDYLKFYELFNYVNKNWIVKDGYPKSIHKGRKNKACGLNSRISDTCIMLKSNDNILKQLDECITVDAEKTFFIAKLAKPYNVKLIK